MIVEIEIPNDSCNNCCLLHSIPGHSCLGTGGIYYYCGRLKKNLIYQSIETNLCHPNKDFPEFGRDWHKDKQKPKQCE